MNIGEELGGVAAIDEATAAKAIELIEIEYEVLPAVTTIPCICFGNPAMCR